MWAGPRGWKGNDFLAVFGLDPRKESYGKLLCVSEIDTSGNEAHHMGLSADRKTLIVGGLFSMIKKQPDVYFFDVSSNATCPPYIGSFDVPDASAADDWKPLPEGGFVGTMMGSANGGTPGGIVKFSGGTPDSYEGVYPQQGGKFVGAEDMNPHGIDIRPEVDLMVTTDYMEPASALRHGPTGGIPRGRTTVRMWKLSTMEITQTINVTKVTGRTHRGNYTGFMDVKFIPGDPSGRSFANGGGVIYLIDPVAGTAEPTYVFDSPEVVRLARLHFLA